MLELVVAEIPEGDDNSESQRKRVELMNGALEIRKKFIEETTSDLVSLHLFGFAAVLAIARFAETSHSLDEINQREPYYPPWRFRLRVLLQNLDYLGLNEKDLIELKDSFSGDERYKEVLKKLIDGIVETIRHYRELVKVQFDLQKINGDPRYRIAFNVLPISKSAEYWGQYKVAGGKGDLELFLANHERLSSKSHKLLDLIKISLPLCFRLYDRYPPNAFEDDPLKPVPANLAQILNAGWMYKLAFLKSLSNEISVEDYIEDWNRLNRLLLYGIELADLQRTYVAQE